MFKTHFRQMVIATVLMGSLGGCAVGVIGGATALASVADRRKLWNCKSKPKLAPRCAKIIPLISNLHCQWLATTVMCYS